MAYCPNCNCVVESGAIECVNCRASFAGGSSWHPTSSPLGPRRVFQHDPPTKANPVTEANAPRQPSAVVRGGMILLILILVPELLALVPWVLYSALSAMAFDAGFSWSVVLWMGAFWAYPALIVICGSIAFILNSKERLGLALITMILPPIVSWGGSLVLLNIAIRPTAS